jgi:hypothetical protein
MNGILLKGNVTAPAVPEITVEQAAYQGDKARAKVSWGECPGAKEYNVFEGTASGVYTKTTVVRAADGLCEYTSGDYNDGTAVYFKVSAVGVNGVESARSAEGNVALDAVVLTTAEFSLTAPVAAENAAEAIVDPAAEYTVKSTAWKDAADQELAIGQPFVAETKYFCTVVLECKEVHKFMPAVPVTLPAGIEDAEVTLNGDSTELTIVCEYLALETSTITFAATAPVKEANAAVATVLPAANYEVTSSAWKTAAQAPLAIGQPFAAETVYHLTVVITAKANHRLANPFADLSITLPATAALVSQNVDASEDENAITIEVSFPATAA